MSVSVENFVKTVYTQGKHPEADTKLSTLAGLLQITKAAATDMAQKLETKNLVVYTKYKPLSLTPQGDELALKVIRKHRLWETFLHQTLKLSLHDIHRAAEHLEHATPDFLTEKIDDYLGRPLFDPHGDPIPNMEGGILANEKSTALSQAEAGRAYIVSRLFSSDEAFFNFCQSNELEPGTIIQLEKQYGPGKMTEIFFNNRTIILNQEISDMIYVEEAGHC